MDKTTKSNSPDEKALRELVTQWRKIAQEKRKIASKLYKIGDDASVSCAFRVCGIKSTFQYCASKLEFELSKNLNPTTKK